MLEHPDCRDQDVYQKTYLFLGDFFQNCRGNLQEVSYRAEKIKEGIEKINFFVQQSTAGVCPACKEVCCISKHGYYNFEDLVYLCALGLKPPALEFGRDESGPCQFLTPKGCSLERPFRPSGCNWYFCEALFDVMENMPGYHQFDDDIRGIAGLWMEMMEEFHFVSNNRI
jgi:hypothetical protein